MLLLPFRTSHSAFRNCAIFLLVTGHLSLVTSAFAADRPITAAWRRGHGAWPISASQAHRYYEDPAVAGPSQLLSSQPSPADFVGTYELAPGQTRTVTSENGASRDERHGRKSREVAVERSG